MSFSQHWQYTPYILPNILAFLVSLGLAIYVWRQRSTPANSAFIVLMLSLATWSLGYTLEIAGADLPTKVFWAKFQYLGVGVAPMAILIFAIRYSARKTWWTSRWALVLLSIIPAITILLAFTNELHGLILREVALADTGPFLALRIQRGVWFWVHVTYSYLDLLAFTILMALAAVRSPHLYRRQALTLFIGIIPVWIANVLYVFDLVTGPIDLTPMAFTITGAILAWGLFRFKLFDILPVAREAIIEKISDGVLVLDAQYRVVDMNQAVQHIVGFPVAQAVGRKVTELFVNRPGLVGLFQVMTERQIEIVLGEGELRRDYEARLSPLIEQAGNITGWLAIFRDVTAGKEDERRYESLLAAAQRQSLELALLDKVRTALARELDLPMVFRAVVEGIAETFGYTLVSLYLLKEEDVLTLQHQVGYEHVIERIPTTQGVTGRVVRTRKPVLLEDVTADSAFLSAVQNITSEICVPLFDQGRVVGVLNVESKEVKLSRADLRLMVALTEQINVAIGRARLYAEAQHRSRLLEGVGEATRCLLKVADWATAMNEALAILGQAAEVDRAYVFENHPHPVTGELVHSKRFEWAPDGTEPQLNNPQLQNISWRVYERWHSILSAGDPVNGPVWELPALERQLPGFEKIRSLLMAPIHIGDTFWGFVGFDDCHTERVWSANEVSALRTMAASIGSAFDRHSAETKLRAQRQLFENLVAVARATAERPALEATLQNALNVAARLTAAEHGSLLLADGTGAVKRSILAGDTKPLNERSPIAHQVIARGLAGWVTRNQQPVLIADTREDDRWLSLPDQPYTARSTLAVPILSGSTLLGVLTLAHSSPGHFDQSHLNLMQAAADQMALALRNAQIFEAQRSTANRQTILYESLRALGEQLEPNAVIRMAVVTFAQFTGWTIVSIALPDPDHQHWHLRYTSRTMLGIKLQYSLDQGITGRAFRTGQTQYAPEVSADPDYVDISPGTRSVLAIPLRREGRILGVLNLESDQSDAFHEDDILLAESFADAAALALDNAQLHQTIADERGQLQALIKSSRDGVILIGANQHILIANAAALHLLGLSGQPEEIVGLPVIQVLRRLRRTSTAAVKITLAGMRRVQLGDESPSEGEFEKPPHSIYWLNLPVNMGSTSVGRLVILRDVSDERALERTRDALTRTMVHDLRSPLTALSGVLSLLQADQTLSPDHEEAVNIALGSADRMTTLVNAILDVSRLETKQMPVERRTFALAPLVAETIKTEAVLADKKGLTLENAIAPEVLIWADSNLIGRVLQNLIDNAIKFTPAGGRVRVASHVLPGHDTFAVSVSDTGIGIPPELHDRLFQKFVTGQHVERGSGLGLAFCRLAVEAHGGRIWMESEPGQGATFTFILPEA